MKSFNFKTSQCSQKIFENSPWIVLAALTIAFASCGKKSSGDAPAEPVVEGTTSPEPTVSPSPTPVPSPTPFAPTTLFDGYWSLESYSCKSGALSVNAKTENELLSAAGIGVDLSLVTLPDGSRPIAGKGRAFRRYEWKFQGNSVERLSRLSLRMVDGKTGSTTYRKKVELKDVTVEAKRVLNSIPDGALKVELMHGALESPTINGVDVSQVSQFIAKLFENANNENAIDKLPIGNLMKNFLKGVSTWFGGGTKVLGSVGSAVEALIENNKAKESVLVQFESDKMVWSKSELAIQSAQVSDLRVLDFSVCGADGKMERNFKRFTP